MAFAKIKELINHSDRRNHLIGKNILFSIILKGINILCSLILVPLTLHYLTGEVYGIWMTLTTILFWVSYFDIGLGNGMRNYLTQALSNNNTKLAKEYISTTLLLLIFIVIIISIIVFTFLPFVNWNQLFNSNALPNNTLKSIITMAILFTFLNFILKNIGVIFMALQKYAVNDLLVVSGNILALLIIFILTKFTKGNLAYVTLAFTASPTIVFLISCIPIFYKYPQLRPSRKYINLSISKSLISKSISFFFIQITSCLVIYGSANVFIAKYAGPIQVSVYNVSYKYFSIIVLGFAIILSPIWNAYTDAYEKGEMQWIRKCFKRTLMIFGITCILGLILLMASSMIYHIWIGNSLHIPFSVSLSVLLYICCYNLNNCVTCLLNGLNIIQVQLYTSIIATMLYFLLVRYIGFGHGIIGVVLSMAFCYAFMSIIHLYQCHIIIHDKAKGIWKK